MNPPACLLRFLPNLARGTRVRVYVGGYGLRQFSDTLLGPSSKARILAVRQKGLGNSHFHRWGTPLKFIDFRTGNGVDGGFLALLSVISVASCLKLPLFCVGQAGRIARPSVNGLPFRGVFVRELDASAPAPAVAYRQSFLLDISFRHANH
jgi:hypothetical protein